MKNKLHIKNTFRTSDTKEMQKNMTEKIQKLLNHQIRKAGQST